MATISAMTGWSWTVRSSSSGSRSVSSSSISVQPWNWTCWRWTKLRNRVATPAPVPSTSPRRPTGLQTCGKLINYDMPWNFMRVEQRIGRIDRIGGQPLVQVSNYFYKDTVEEQIYHGIGEDFDWFTDVVGPAQPVLNQVERAIETVAMTAPSQARQQQVATRVAEIRSQIEEAKAEAITLDDLESV